MRTRLTKHERKATFRSKRQFIRDWSTNQDDADSPNGLGLDGVGNRCNRTREDVGGVLLACTGDRGPTRTNGDSEWTEEATAEGMSGNGGDETRKGQSLRART